MKKLKQIYLSASYQANNLLTPQIIDIFTQAGVKVIKFKGLDMQKEDIASGDAMFILPPENRATHDAELYVNKGQYKEWNIAKKANVEIYVITYVIDKTNVTFYASKMSENNLHESPYDTYQTLMFELKSPVLLTDLLSIPTDEIREATIPADLTNVDDDDLVAI